ncbi:hypothetical protein M413DRAFT_239904 [Hebeloma cylindrosporum]|uniref:Uncharacterized protein n=1 Tax=Hebeloma cylindrosporum TaxID=76867 RepID=A0A0C3BPT7_HEBCY|nr:hypothetical protein M413DRAFT_239904 [Hebeloma cylindrosporum h7]
MTAPFTTVVFFYSTTSIYRRGSFRTVGLMLSAMRGRTVFVQGAQWITSRFSPASSILLSSLFCHGITPRSLQNSVPSKPRSVSHQCIRPRVSLQIQLVLTVGI